MACDSHFEDSPRRVSGNCSHLKFTDLLVVDFAQFDKKLKHNSPPMWHLHNSCRPLEMSCTLPLPLHSGHIEGGVIVVGIMLMFEQLIFLLLSINIPNS